MTTPQPQPPTSDPTEKFGFVEQFGHRQFIGGVREAIIFGATMCEIHPLRSDGTFDAPIHIAGSSIFSHKEINKNQALQMVGHRVSGELPARAGRDMEDEDRPGRSVSYALLSLRNGEQVQALVFGTAHEDTGDEDWCAAWLDEKGFASEAPTTDASGAFVYDQHDEDLFARETLRTVVLEPGIVAIVGITSVHKFLESVPSKAEAGDRRTWRERLALFFMSSFPAWRELVEDLAAADLTGTQVAADLLGLGAEDMAELLGGELERKHGGEPVAPAPEHPAQADPVVLVHDLAELGQFAADRPDGGRSITHPGNARCLEMAAPKPGEGEAAPVDEATPPSVG